MLLLVAVFAIGAYAQKFYPVRPYPRSHVVITTGVYAPYYPYGYVGPFYPYPYPFGYYPVRETKLERKIEDIQNDYKDRIWSARHDNTLSRKERKATVHELKHERDLAIADAKKNYYKTKA
jgi:hypothetical protein